jgi:glycine/D-amino acid oxidase-like deaminating enzyme
MDITIVGGGLFGLATAREAARRGHRAVLHEMATIPSPLAASHDVSKAYRHVYGEKSDFYAPLVRDAIEEWRVLEREAGRTILHPVGFLAIATDSHADSFEAVSARVLRRLAIRHEFLSTAELRRRFPMFSVPDAATALFDLDAGWIDPAAALLALRESARRAGAVIHEHSPVPIPAAVGGDIVIVTAGPWLSKLLPALRPGIAPTLQHEWFFAPRHPTPLPVWSFDIATRGFYGFPTLPSSSLAPFAGTNKVASHLHGSPDDPDGARARDDADAARTSAFVSAHFPFLDATPVAHRPCFYANSLNGHFIFDRLPDTPRIVVAGGGSGHAFKFGPLLGRFALDVADGQRPRPEFAIDRVAGRTV